MGIWLEKVFHLSEHQTDFKTEVLAGATTFLTMVYIVFLQPAILTTDPAGHPTGMDFGAVLVATCVGSAIATIAMGLYTRYPLALAPGMGENVFFVSVISSLAALGVAQAWRAALGIVFVSGLVFVALSLLRVREAIIDSVSPSLRGGIAAGIGLFIALIGLKNGGLVVARPGTLVGLNPQLISADVGIFLGALLLTSALMAWRIRGAILWGILAATLAALGAGKTHYTGLVGFPEIRQQAAFQMDVRTAVSWLGLPYVLVFVIMEVFDNVGTLIAVAQQAGLIRNNQLPRASRVLLVDSVGTVAGAALGTSTITSYIESAAGVAAGGRTGLTSVTTGLLFFVPLFLSPAVGMVGTYLPIMAPALVLVGAMMLQNVKHVDWEDPSEYIPAFLTVIGIPLFFSIADGLALGFVSYPVLKGLCGRARDVRWPMLIVSATLLLYFLFVRTRFG